MWPGMSPFTGSAHRRVASAAPAVRLRTPAAAAPDLGGFGSGQACAGVALGNPGTRWRSLLDAVWAAIDSAPDASRPGAPRAPGAPAGSRGSQGSRPDRDDVVDSRIVALVELAKGGDREAFGQLYDAYVDTVHRYLFVRVGQRALAEDLTSETFLRALRRIDSFTWQGKDIAAWFITIARNLVADHVKSSRFRFEVTTADMRDADEHVEAPDELVLARQRDAHLVEAIRRLRPDQAECVTLRFLHGFSLADTARVLGRSEGAVKQLQLRAVRALRTSLEGLEP
jgi:RNA polymerase sigma-70 factor (TIGR02952 family)